MYASLETDVTPQARTIGADESREEDNTGLIRSVRVRASPGSDGASPYRLSDALCLEKILLVVVVVLVLDLLRGLFFSIDLLFRRFPTG
jgi:hypothetical protein